MIIRVVKLVLLESKKDEFLKTFSDAHREIKSFKGCTYLELLESKTSGIVFTYSHWESDDALQLYLNSEFFKNVWKTVKPMFAGKAEAWSLIKFEPYKFEN